jgi:dTMP kinase
MDAHAEVLLYSAARAQHVVRRIRPALADGLIVITDRYADSTLAYQGYGRGIDLTTLHTITDFATGGLWPDLTLYIDITPEEGLRRRRLGGDEWNRLDGEALEFHQRVRSGYLALIQQDPQRWCVVDGAGSVEEVGIEVSHLVTARLKATHR